MDLDQIFSFVAALNAEQVSTAASVPFEQYIKITSNTGAPHAEDIEELQIILSLMDAMVVISREDSSTTLPNATCLVTVQPLAVPQNTNLVLSNTKGAD